MLKEVRLQSLVDYISRLTADELEDIHLISRLKTSKEIRLMMEGAKRQDEKDALEMLSTSLVINALRNVR